MVVVLLKLGEAFGLDSAIEVEAEPECLRSVAAAEDEDSHRDLWWWDCPAEDEEGGGLGALPPAIL